MGRNLWLRFSTSLNSKYNYLNDMPVAIYYIVVPMYRFTNQ